MEFAIRAVVLCAIMCTFYLVRDFGSIYETAVMSAIASLTSQAVVTVARAARTGASIPRLPLGFTIAGVIAAAVAMAVLVTHAPAGPLAYVMVDELGDPAAHEGVELKLHGFVALGSIKTQVIDGESVRTLVLARNGKQLRVRHVGVAPDTLQDRAEVIAQGRIVRAADGAYELAATDLLARCPTTYQTSTGPKPASQFR